MPTTTEEMQATTTTQDKTSSTIQGSQPQTSQDTGMTTGGEGRRSSAMSRRDPLGLGLGTFGNLANPFATMRAFSDEMDRLFESFGLGGPGRSRSGLSRQGGQGFWSPQIDVARRGNELVVCADLPGMKKEDLHVEMREDLLVLHGERNQEHQEENGFYERSYGRFHRTIPLPEGVNPEQVQASFKDGVLEIRMPLPEQQQQRAREIEIR